MKNKEWKRIGYAYNESLVNPDGTPIYIGNEYYQNKKTKQFADSWYLQSIGIEVN